MFDRKPAWCVKNLRQTHANPRQRGGGAGLAVSNSCAGLPAHWPGVHRQHSQKLTELKWWLVKQQTEFYVNVA